jgi:hypothetical protein
MPRYARIEGSETPLAIGDQTSICGRLLQCQNAAQIPKLFSDNFPRPHTTPCGYGSQVHSPKDLYSVLAEITIAFNLTDSVRLTLYKLEIGIL